MAKIAVDQIGVLGRMVLGGRTQLGMKFHWMVWNQSKSSRHHSKGVKAMGGSCLEGAFKRFHPLILGFGPPKLTNQLATPGYCHVKSQNLKHGIFFNLKCVLGLQGLSAKVSHHGAKDKAQLRHIVNSFGTATLLWVGGFGHRTQGVSRITRSFTGVNCLLRYRVSDQDHGAKGQDQFSIKLGSRNHRKSQAVL